LNAGFLTQKGVFLSQMSFSVAFLLKQFGIFLTGILNFELFKKELRFAII